MTTCDLNHLCAERARGVQPSAIREICKLVDQPDMKSLAGGWPDPDLFPAAELSQITADLLQTKPERVLQYGTTEGLPELRQALALYMAGQENISVDPDQLLVTQGSAQGMDLACRVLIDPGDTVFVGLPTYFGGTGAITAAGGNLAGIEVDTDGLNVDLLEQRLQEFKAAGRRTKAVYVIPNFQNPTGTTLTLARRRKLLELAATFDLIIIEDDPYGDLRYEGQRLPSLLALDQAGARPGRVIHLRSTSKIFTPGLRLGWVAGNPGLIRKMAVAKQFVDCATNSLSQYLLLEFMHRGLLEKRIAANNAHYRAKRDFMLDQLARNFHPDVTWNRPLGGFFIFLHFPPQVDTLDLLAEAVKHKVAFVAGAPFYVDGSGSNTLRLSFSQADTADIEEALIRLGALVRRRMAA